MENITQYELNDDELDNVNGGYSVGDVVRVRSHQINYCQKCGRLLLDYEATITGVRGVLDGHTQYWVERKCCGYKSCVIETAIR